jgi:hypothetical protein
MKIIGQLRVTKREAPRIQHVAQAEMGGVRRKSEEGALSTAIG